MENNIAKNIKKLRLDNNLSQKEFGQIFHVTNSTVSYWEKGEREIASETLIKIASYFNITLDDLYGTTKLLNNDYQAVYRSIKVYDFSSEAKNYHLYIRSSYVFFTILLNLIFPNKSSIIFIFFIISTVILFGYDLYVLLITPNKKIKTYNVRINKEINYESSWPEKKIKNFKFQTLLTAIWSILMVWLIYPFVHVVFFEASQDPTIMSHIGFLIFSTTIAFLILIVTDIRTKEYKLVVNTKNSHFRFNYFSNKLAWIFKSLIFIYTFLFVSFYGRNYFDHDLVIWIIFVLIPLYYLHGYYIIYAKINYYNSLNLVID